MRNHDDNQSLLLEYCTPAEGKKSHAAAPPLNSADSKRFSSREKKKKKKGWTFLNPITILFDLQNDPDVERPSRPGNPPHPTDFGPEKIRGRLERILENGRYIYFFVRHTRFTHTPGETNWVCFEKVSSPPPERLAFFKK